MDKNTLRQLFNNSLYLKVIETEVRRSSRIQHSMPMHGTLSPNSQLLLSLFTPETQKRLARDFYLDDIEINKKLLKDEIEDPTYIYFNNSGVGLYLELWVCVNIKCPGCGDTLYKYANPNMPAVDVRCINPSHNNTLGPLYYQIKATQKGVTYAGLKYFSYDEEYICVGSYKYGHNCHEIKADNIIDRDLLIGYICIEYIYKDMNNINIDMNKSFILIPNLQFVPANTLQMEWTYYHYEKIVPVPVIKFNTNMINKYRFSDLYKPFGVIKLSNQYDAVKIYEDDSLPMELDFKSSKYKYLIMKMKYLNLKKLFKKTI